MKLLKVFPDNPNGRYIELAAEAMRRGEIVVYLLTRFMLSGVMP